MHLRRDEITSDRMHFSNNSDRSGICYYLARITSPSTSSMSMSISSTTR